MPRREEGFLLVATCSTPAAHAAAPVLTISPPPTTDGRLVEVPYTLDSSATSVSRIGIELRAPGAASFEPYTPWGSPPTSRSGTIAVPLYAFPAAVVEGEWGIRVTAYGPGDDVIERAEGSTRLDWMAVIWVSAPYFDPLGSTSGSKRLRIENGLWGPLRVKQVQLPAGSELTIVDDGCSGQTLYCREGCYVELTCTPNALDWHRATLLVDANAATKEIYMLCNGA